MQCSDPAAELVGSRADPRLLDEGAHSLPQAVGRPKAAVPSKSRARLVAIGATLTGVTLLLGVVLTVLGLVELLWNGLSALHVAELAIGGVLVGTHWGWVHVAEAAANVVGCRRDRELEERRGQWLDAIEPYTRYEVRTEVRPDGSLSILRTRHQPIPTGEHSFAFTREVIGSEVHSGEEAASVAERAELLRRQAALETERERKAFQVARDAYETSLLARGEEDRQAAARRAASQALSEQINSRLRDPPLTE